MFKNRKMVKKAASHALCQLEDECSRLQAENDALRAARERAVEAAVGLENEVAKLKAEIALSERAVRYLREKLQAAEGDAQTRLDAFNDLRQRIYMLLRSADQDAEIFGLPRYTLKSTDVTLHAPVITEHETEKVFYERLNGGTGNGEKT